MGLQLIIPPHQERKGQVSANSGAVGRGRREESLIAKRRKPSARFPEGFEHIFKISVFFHWDTVQFN